MMVPTMVQAVVRLVVCVAFVFVMNAELSAQVDFNREIRPILAEYCFHCHGPDANQRAADLRLDVAEEAHQSAIQVHDADASELIARVTTEDLESRMPPAASGKELSAEQIALLRQWINEGANYSRHWAFERIRDRQKLLEGLPPNNSEASVIDRFLHTKLLASGLDYSPEVSREQYIRRATFDLTGLPPSWDEIQAFVADDSPNYLENLLDRLLASPQYGERWGRHWLDLARYADTHGGAAIGFTTFPFAYTYRDYVIQAFNRDLPIDRFILEQIAADQLDLPKNDPALAALGFLTVGMQFRNEHDTIDDQIDVVTRGLMGLTVTCARCHDHKFDEISTADYYGIYAAMAPSKAPAELPIVGEPANTPERNDYEQTLTSLKLKLDSFVRDQSEVMRARLRMQVGLYLGEIAKGVGEQDTSTVFLSYRTDDLRPIILNRWLSYLKSLGTDDAVFGPWLEMQSWGKLESNEFITRCETYLAKLSAELDRADRNPAHIHALRSEPPKWSHLIVDALVAKKPTSLADVAAVYGSVFVEVQRQWLGALARAAEEATAEEKILPDDHPEHQMINSPVYRQLRHHLYAPDSPFMVSDDVAMTLTNRTINDLIGAKRGAIHQLHLAAAGSPPRAMIVTENPAPEEQHVFLRGNPLARGPVVHPQFLTVLNLGEARVFENGKRRLGLAQAIVAPENPLTSRVLVNWVWQNHFGAGLVRTPDDFGTRGQPPTHPELLDYLAREFQQNGWSLKWLHRQIMLTRAYRQGAIENEVSRERDPDNLLLWRMPRKRLDFESMRDAMLSVSGELDLQAGGRPIDLNATPAIPRRSVYGFTNRDIIANLMSTFDSANPNACTAKRPETTVPQQTLFALNSDFIQDRAARVALVTKTLNLPNFEARAREMIQRILGREPTQSELERVNAFLRNASEAANVANSAGDTENPENRELNHEQVTESAWTQLAHALLASNEFIFLD
ncbi:MAG: PSD1 domain-containing protein [Planctomycetaceae bacterium]|nr:PSD1 domain-containing protein [Planctomycetaceae bacterium]